MREILFRGKRKFNGEWVYGWSYCDDDDYCAIIEKDQSKLHPLDQLTVQKDIDQFDGQVTRVIPETVGQWTGMTDKNGKKIFEGDIVHYDIHYSRPVGRSYLSSEYDQHKVGPVVFDEDSCAFLPLSYCVRDTLVVAGNIYDNPELLKGE